MLMISIIEKIIIYYNILKQIKCNLVDIFHDSKERIKTVLFPTMHTSTTMQTQIKVNNMIGIMAQ